jgi:hypothetical protein
MYKNATKCNETIGKWCKNKHGASKIIDTFETYHYLFLELRLAFVFCLNFCSDLVLSLHQGVFGPLIYIGIHQKSCFKKV